MTAIRLHVRPYAPCDADEVRAMAARLSPRTLYRRFFTGTPTLPPVYYAALARVDHDDREALLAFEGDVAVGIAEYVRHEEHADQADVAVMVADRWQGRGVGRALLAELVALACGRGITAFTAEVLAENRPALAAITSAWPDCQRRLEGTTVTLTLPLIAASASQNAAVAEPTCSRPGRARRVTPTPDPAAQEPMHHR